MHQLYGFFMLAALSARAQPSPACLQIYPTLVIRGTGLYELWKKGLYRNYDPSLLVDLVACILALVPPWVRIYRIQVCLRQRPSLACCCQRQVLV